MEHMFVPIVVETNALRRIASTALPVTKSDNRNNKISNTLFSHVCLHVPDGDPELD